MIDIPAGATASMKQGVLPHVLLKLTFGSAVYRFAKDAARDVSWDGQTWLVSGNPLVEIGNAGQEHLPGTLELTLNDAAGTWHTRFETHGEKGNEVEVAHVQPYGDPVQYWTRNLFVGRTLRAARLRPKGRRDETPYRLAVECADEAAFPEDEEGNNTSDSYQRSLDSTDDSMAISTKARRLVWHRV